LPLGLTGVKGGQTMSDEEKGFVIKDRRAFAEEGEDSKVSDDQKQAAREPDSETSEAQPAQEETAAAEHGEAEAPLPKVNFPTFVISLNASALVHLGAIEDPASGENASGEKVKNLPMAKQTIDILSMLEEKSRGNLTNEEENILKNILYDLRILYVKATG
jgi:hypothetical protein